MFIFFSVVNLMLGIYIKNVNAMIEFYAQKSFIAIYKRNRNISIIQFFFYDDYAITIK